MRVICCYRVYLNVMDPSSVDGEWMEVKRIVNPDSGEEAMVKVKHGTGKYVQGDVMYEGQFMNDMMHGVGELRFASGASYRGSFKDNMFEGEGKYSWPSGAMYEGEWIQNKMHGNGVFSSSDGKRWSGSYYGGMGEGVDQELLD